MQSATSVTHIGTGFDFLGQNVRKYDGKLLITPSKKNVATFLANVREVVKAHKTTTAGNLVMLLNPKIKGWAMYHRHIKIRADVNPYSPDWADYLERRHSDLSFRSRPAQGSGWSDARLPTISHRVITV